MSATDRQNRLLVAEDWKRIYQSFRNADFQSYDFENLRRVMISYIRENYPEDFNDYVESSEYLALIDLIAFLGQSLAFRTDLNARENFLELAERRESVLRLARLLSYRVKRNIPASGLLKFNTVSTTQNVYDSNGRNLAGQTVSWNDPANSNWYDQFVKVLNSALPSTQQFGNAIAKDTIYGIPTEQYRLQSVNQDVPVYAFTKSVDGRSMNFEVVSTTFASKDEIYEEAPSIGNRLAFLFRDDGKGYGSNNTGFFLQFKQGSLSQGSFELTQPAPDESVDVDAVNINNSDVWLYRLDKNGAESEYWTPVPALEGNNVIYNSLHKSIKNIYGVVTRNSDRISLIFSDGVFGNLPQGQFRVYYRTSNGLNYTINPKDIKNVAISIPYVSNAGQLETLTVTLNLTSSVANSSATETNDSVKTRAPATYYTQNRMITGEDYNISPLSVNQQVVKVKATNRSSSGVSRYFDLVDPTGKYSKTNLFADDGVLYKENYTDSFRFKYTSRTDIQAVIYNQVIDVLTSTNLKNFYYRNFPPASVYQLDTTWALTTAESNISTGAIIDSTEQFLKVGSYTTTLFKFFTVGALVKFTAPAGKYFDKSDNNTLKSDVTPMPANSTKELWAKVVSVTGDGTSNLTGVLSDGTGPIVLNDIVPNGAIVYEVIPAWRSTIETSVVNTMVELIFANKPFGLRYDTESRTWKIITETNLNIAGEFSLGRQGDTSNQKIDSSWFLLFTTDTEYYTVKWRNLRYIFESAQQVRFYFDSSDKIYDTRTNTVVKDVIKVLGINSKPNSTSSFTQDLDWEITEEFKGMDGYIDTKKIQLAFSDLDDDSVVDDPTLFEQVVPVDGYVVLEKYTIAQGQEDYRYVDNSNDVVIISDSESLIFDRTAVGQHYYFIDTQTVKYLNAVGEFVPSLNYKVFQGRDKLKFQYIHNADYEARIDPGVTNLIDVYVLTKQYDVEYRQWLNDTVTIKPLPPSSDFLYNLLAPELNKIKSISDEIVYYPAKYKVLFGSKATSDVRASFKVVKNSEVVISDNDVKTRVLAAIGEFFALENWEFGDSFYFSELAAYVMNQVSPFIVNFVIVPTQSDLNFGSLYEIRSEKDQIFINGATIDDIEIISAVTASRIRSTGAIAAETKILSQQSITSSGSI